MWPAKQSILLVVAVQVAQAWRRAAKNRAVATFFREGDPSIITTPASHISYGGSVWLQVADSGGEPWLTGGRGFGNEGVHTRMPSLGEFTYEWKVRSNAGNGNIGTISEEDPAAGQCVKYGDVVWLQVQNLANRWLTGGRDPFPKFVHTYNHLENAFERARSLEYMWQVRSNPGTGNVAEADPRGGQCVDYGDVVWLQIQNMPNRWLSGGRGDDHESVRTYNHLDGGYEQTVNLKKYQWKLGHMPLILRVVGVWRQELAVFTCTNYTTTIGWSKTVTDEFALEVLATASAEFSVFGKAVSASMSSKVTTKSSSSITQTINTTVTKEMCAIDGAYVWAWRFYVARGDTDMGYVTTSFKVQADTRPHCFPEEQWDAKYTSCKPDGCLENCWPFKVGDHVLITESARSGEITEQQLSDRPFFVTFSDGASPPSGWYPESVLSLVTSK